jgi:DnaK suppressor protein
MNKTFLKKIKKQLLAEKDYIIKTTVTDIDVDTDGDETDAIQGKILIEITNHMNIRNVNKLRQIEAALSRLEDGKFGICEDCEELIPEKRILINPYCQTCVCCAEDRESEAKKGNAVKSTTPP